MTAALVTHESRAPLSADLAARIADEQADILGIPSFSIAGDANAWTARPAGQLWERVAERDKEVSDTYASERFLNAWYRSRVGGSDLARVSGYRYVKAVYTETLRSGIIRAGERVK